MIKVLALDLNDVYFENVNKIFVKKLHERFNLSEYEIKEVFFKRTNKMMKDYKLGKISGDEFWGWAIKEWGIDSTQEEILQILADGYSINQEAKEFINKLKSQGIKIALCTNNFVERIKVINEKLDFLKDFDIQVFSYEEGFMKPDFEIFKILIKKSQVKPNEILFFDDKEKNVEAAKSLNISACLYKNFEQMVKKIKELGVNL